jgi:hypothetical protein
MKEKSKYLLATLASILFLLTSYAPSEAQQGLTVSIEAGSTVQNGTEGFTFPPNTATVTGGSGSYTYLWSDTNDGGAKWFAGGTSQSFSPRVIEPITCNFSQASYTVTVTDKVTGATVTSNGAFYIYNNIGGACD